MGRMEQRRDRLRRLLRKTGAKVILVTSETNVTYLTGFTGDSSILLLDLTGELMLSDSRYTTQLEEECPGLKLEIRKPGTTTWELTQSVIKKSKISQLAIEADSLSVSQLDALTEKLPNVEFIKTTGLVEQLRAIKDKEEIVAIRYAVELAEKAFAVIRASIRPELTERQIAFEIENQIRSFGGDACAFNPIVAVGPRAALPHATPGHHRVEESGLLLVDWGALAQLYRSDLTRILVTGKISPKLERIYGVVLKAQVAAIKAIRPGALLKDVDAAARKVIANSGHDRHFGHGLGHGIGLQIHESPRIAANFEGQLEAGMVVTVEPGVYLPNWGGVRIEDDVLVTRDGHEVLSTIPKGLADSVIG